MPTYATNKRAKFDYEILQTIEAGILLLGHEVKAVRNKQINLKGAYISIQNEKVILKHAHISPYRFAGNLEGGDPEHDRKLLLKKKEIAYLKGKSQEKSLTIVPISVYTKGPNIKLEIAVVRGKKRYDKREVIKKREQGREIRRKMKE